LMSRDGAATGVERRSSKRTPLRSRPPRGFLPTQRRRMERFLRSVAAATLATPWTRAHSLHAEARLCARRSERSPPSKENRTFAGPRHLFLTSRPELLDRRELTREDHQPDAASDSNGYRHGRFAVVMLGPMLTSPLRSAVALRRLALPSLRLRVACQGHAREPRLRAVSPAASRGARRSLDFVDSILEGPDNPGTRLAATWMCLRGAGGCPRELPAPEGTHSRRCGSPSRTRFVRARSSDPRCRSARNPESHFSESAPHTSIRTSTRPS
jgi:hypothetical protein